MQDYHTTSYSSPWQKNRFKRTTKKVQRHSCKRLSFHSQTYQITGSIEAKKNKRTEIERGGAALVRRWGALQARETTVLICRVVKSKRFSNYAPCSPSVAGSHFQRKACEQQQHEKHSNVALTYISTSEHNSSHIIQHMNENANKNSCNFMSFYIKNLIISVCYFKTVLLLFHNSFVCRWPCDEKM